MPVALRACGTKCVVLIATPASVNYPATKSDVPSLPESESMKAVTSNRYVVAFSLGAFLYVAVESAVYVWVPTLVAGYRGTVAWLAVYSISMFFQLRATRRLVGAWMLNSASWTAVLAVFAGLIFA